MRLPPYRRLLLPSLAASAFALGAAPVEAQVPTVSPGGELADPAAPPPREEPAQPAPPAPPVVVVGPDGETQVQTPEPEGPAGFYFDDARGPSLYGDDPGALGRTGPVPAVHTVRTGDTLWDICWFYFNNPWEWPRIWSYNPEITNPHWIYPGDRVRLRAKGEGPAGEESGEGAGAESEPQRLEASSGGEPRPRGWFSIRQLAFVDQQKLDYGATVAGSTNEKLLLSEGDAIYLSYPEGKPPEVGKRYAIYEEQRTVEHPKTGKTVGAYVKVIGELEVTSVKKGKKARAVITDSADVVERGHRVGPLKRTFKDVQPTPNETDLQGTIVAQLEADKLIGARHVVFIDRGASHGVEKGNTMFVVRRGDAYPDPGGRASNRGLDDRRFPARAIGEVLVVQAGESSSVGLVSLSIQEIEPGDLVLMRKAGGGGDR